MLEAKDLPQNNLSMLLEQRVNRKLEEDRQARAVQQVRGRADRVACEVECDFGDRAVVLGLAACDVIGSDSALLVVWSW
jgi:hypothetical protein